VNDFTLNRSDVRSMLWHLALYGLAAICEEAGIDDLRIRWTRGLTPHGRVETTVKEGRVLDDQQVAAIVHHHALERSVDPSWLLQDIDVKGSRRGLMSPRLSAFPDAATWEAVQQARHRVLDQLTGRHAWLDLRMIAALGEPCYWSHNRQQQPLQDDGASRLEMQPRNQGSEFIGSRLRKLATSVATRVPEAVSNGLAGEFVADEIGREAVDSRTPTGLASPGPTDNAVAWCALWGISQFPLAMRVNATAVTSGHLGRPRREWFYLPVWHEPWQPARLRSILASAQLHTASAGDLPRQDKRGRPTPWAVRDSEVLAAQRWLLTRGVEGVIRFPIARFGTDKAPERRAMNGEKVSLR
jgi:CRISPR-associated protein Csb3